MPSRLLKDNFPEYIKDWDDNKNIGVDKNRITIGSSKIPINWKCHVCGYQWVQKIDRRIKHKTECKICNRKDKLLKYTHPELFVEIDRTKNVDLNLELITNGTSRKVWWICKNGHSWFQNIDTRVRLGSSCRFCKSFKESFVKAHPDLLKEWDYVKNKGLVPNFRTKG